MLSEGCESFPGGGEQESVLRQYSRCPAVWPPLMGDAVPANWVEGESLLGALGKNFSSLIKK